MLQPAISIIIANWNGKVLLEACLKSIFAQNCDDYEVIVVDNGSTDKSVAYIEKNCPKVRLIKNPENTGFARANNQGILAAKGKFILTLNNDTCLDADFLSVLLKAVKNSDNKVGMWGVKILSMRDKRVIDSVGGLLLYPDGLARGRGRLELDDGQYDDIDRILMPSACAALYRRRMLDETGLFDEDFFAYCEDTDLGLRARIMGWQAASVPRAVVYHSYSATSGEYSAFKAYHIERNRAYVAFKNFPLPHLLASPFHTLGRYAAMLSSIRSGKGASARIKEKISAPALFFILIKSYFAIIVKLPKLLSKRRSIQRKRTVPDIEFSRWLLKDGIDAAELILKD